MQKRPVSWLRLMEKAKDLFFRLKDHFNPKALKRHF